MGNASSLTYVFELPSQKNNAGTIAMSATIYNQARMSRSNNAQVTSRVQRQGRQVTP